MKPFQAADLAALHRELGVPPNYAATRNLPLQPEAQQGELVSIRSTVAREIRLIAPTAAAWTRMRTAAASESIELVAQSGFRSVARQAEIFRAKLDAGRTIAEILHIVAAPGHSEHHTGRAIDIGTPDAPPLEESFGDTPTFAWLTAHARDFGFTLSYPLGNAHGIVYEPWHWYWRP